ncbi:hypothetical protein EDB80DRAFT_618501, partial [Ilyonectria destructans]
MKVAIVGTGAVARYLVDELLSQKHDVVAISRSRKAWLDDLGIKQHEAQYTVAKIVPALEGCDAVVCAVSSSAPELVQIHESLLEACKSTPCKRFIPSVWVGNFENVPDQPYYGADRIQKIYDMLAGQQMIEWTLLSVGWLIDYVVPASQRYLPDDDVFWVQNAKEKIFKLYGSGTQAISCTATRDAACAVVRLLETGSKWEPFTYISGEQLRWIDLWNIIKEYHPEYSLATKSLTESIKQLVESKDEMTTLVAVFDVMGHSEALCYPQERVDRHREVYFRGVKFRSVKELIKDARANP